MNTKDQAIAHTCATNSLASSTAYLADRLNSAFQSVSRHRVHAWSPSGDWILSVSYPCLIILCTSRGLRFFFREAGSGAGVDSGVPGRASAALSSWNSNAWKWFDTDISVSIAATCLSLLFGSVSDLLGAREYASRNLMIIGPVSTSL